MLTTYLTHKGSFRPRTKHLSNVGVAEVCGCEGQQGDPLEKMAVSQDIKVQEVLDFTVLEGLADKGHDVLEQCKKYMKTNTVQHCEEVEKYFY